MIKKILIFTLLFSFLFVFLPLIPFQGQTATPIKHVVIIILENHAFDNLFGTYPFGNPPIYSNITESLMRPLGLNLSVIIPYNPDNVSKGGMKPYYANSVILADPTEGYTAYHTDWNRGTMNGFILGSGKQSLAYVSYKQVPLLWDYAEEYVLSDNYFSPVLISTQPNRVAYLTGYPTKILGDGFVSSAIPFQNTIMYQLSEYGISWAYFDYGYHQGQSLPPFPLVVFSSSEKYSSHYFNTSVFLQDLKNGSLPDVSWLMFTGGDGHDTHSALDLHPPFNLTEGQINLVKYINAIMESEYWNSTVIFITFDEGGGFYDQVPPPIIYTYGEGCDHYLEELGIYNYSILGQRTPLLIISPYAKEGWVNNYSISGYTILGFIDYNWHLPYLTKIVANSNVYGILQSFNFSVQRPPVILSPHNWSYPIPLQYPIHYGYVATVKGNYTGYYLLYEKGYINQGTLDYIMQFSQYTNISIPISSTLPEHSNVTTNITINSSSYIKCTYTYPSQNHTYFLVLFIIVAITIIGTILVIRNRR
jgi:phospholipase C